MAHKKLFIFILVLVTIMTSCTDVGMEDTRKKIIPNEKDTIIVEQDLAIAKDLDHSVDTTELHVACDEMESKVTFRHLENFEVIDSVTFTEYPSMDTRMYVINDDYTITPDLLESEVIDSKIKRNYDKTHVSDNGYEEKDTVEFYFNDGQLVKVPVVIMTFSVDYHGDCHMFGSDTLISARLVSAKNIETRKTRAAYVTQQVTTEYHVELTFAEKNTRRDSTFVVNLKGYATRNILAEDAIETVVVSNKHREVIDETTERVSFDEITTMKSGEVVTVSKSMILNREFKGIDPYDKFVSSFAYDFEKANGITEGQENAVKNETGWSVYGKTDIYSAELSNNNPADNVSTSYSLYHERAIYKDEYVTVEFGYENVNVDEVKTTSVTTSSDKSGYDKAILTNEVATSYIGYTQNISEYVNLYKVAKAVEFEGWDESTAKMTISNENVICSIDWITRYNTGETEKESYSKTFSRSLKVTSKWSSTEENANHTTGDADVTVTSNKKTDGFWSWSEETRTITTLTTLNASEQTNSWLAVDPNDITITREGKNYEFGTTTFNAKENGASVNIKEDAEEYTLYTYTDMLSVTFGSNTQNTSATGEITVEKEIKGDFPVEWGRFVKATCTVACNEDVKDWVYTWSIHFENGTLPVVLRKDDNTANINQSYFEYKVDARFNGGSYVDGTWINSIASDEGNYMLWVSNESKVFRMFTYPTATAWGWNNKSNSVFTDRYTFEIQKDGKVLVVKKDGKDFAKYRTSVK